MINFVLVNVQNFINIKHQKKMITGKNYIGNTLKATGSKHVKQLT